MKERKQEKTKPTKQRKGGRKRSVFSCSIFISAHWMPGPAWVPLQFRWAWGDIWLLWWQMRLKAPPREGSESSALKMRRNSPVGRRQIHWAVFPTSTKPGPKIFPTGGALFSSPFSAWRNYFEKPKGEKSLRRGGGTGGVAAQATSALTFEWSCLETDSYRQLQRKGQAPAARPRGRRCSEFGAPPESLALYFAGSLSFALWRRVRECGASRARVFHLSGANVFAQRCVPSLPSLYLMREAVASCPISIQLRSLLLPYGRSTLYPALSSLSSTRTINSFSHMTEFTPSSALSPPPPLPVKNNISVVYIFFGSFLLTCWEGRVYNIFQASQAPILCQSWRRFVAGDSQLEKIG